MDADLHAPLPMQLALYTNKLTGTLPDSWSFSGLQQLSVAQNRLQGPLPPSWSRNYPSVFFMDFRYNNLSGVATLHGFALGLCTIAEA